MATIRASNQIAPTSPYVLALRQLGNARSGKTITGFTAGMLEIEVRTSHDSVWAFIRREGTGALALRTAYLTGDFECAQIPHCPGEVARIKVHSAAGEHLIAFKAAEDGQEVIRATVTLTPAAPVFVPFVPRDLYPLDGKGDPIGAKGRVEATQRGLNSGLLYFRIEEPAFGNVLYFQNLTAMNDYYRATKTKPESVVGGVWPELGHLLPTVDPGEAPSGEGLRAGEPVIISDAIIVVRHEAPSDERQSARQFLQMLGVAYQQLELPTTEFRDWTARAEQTLHDLEEAPEATIEHYGHRYIHPYTGAEYPDAMVQMSLITAIHQWGKWRGEPQPLEAQLMAGMSKFYDPRLKTLRRYLPNVGDDKDADAVDSWYLYHPLLNLGMLALDGDAQARRLLFKSLDYGIKAAHHFKYKWPVQYNVTDLSVITDVAEADGRGQTDVGGIYAWVMLQAFELSDDKRYLDEARAAIDAAMGLGFAINYQANLTAWGAAACMRLWRITNQSTYLEQSYVYLASFFHNCEIWESEIELAAHYKNFLGVTCLQDAPYMAIYECFESFASFENYLNDSGPDLDPAVRMLISEYCRYALDRAWYYYPDALPPEAISPKQRENNGHIDRKLSFPLEDLYPDSQPAGQVGQEIYGAGAAFVFATRSFHHVEGAPFRLHCDHFIRAQERTADSALSVTLDGGETCTARLSLVRLKWQKLPKPTLTTAGGDVLRPVPRSKDRIDFEVPANGRFTLTWRPDEGS